MDIYHALNRGVDKRQIFMDDGDRVRFIHDMYAFNTTRLASNTFRNDKLGLRDLTYMNSSLDERLVDIHGWCLMGNHYHLLLSECIEGGLSMFLRKVNTGYANYFNARYERVGTLFQGRTKKILIDSDAYMLHILNYIHLNPLDLMQETTEWRSRSITNHQSVLNFLHEYRWSSYKDYAGIKNFPSILTKDFFQDVFGGQYRQQLEKYLKDIDVDTIQHLLHE
jgi:putative transposase